MMNPEKLISALNGMILSSDNEPKMAGWVKEFLIELKSQVEKQVAYKDALDEIDTHIRSTGDPIPYIVQTLKRVLPQYQE